MTSKDLATDSTWLPTHPSVMTTLKHGYRAMLLFEICPGDTYVLQRDDETLTEPPEGFNSVDGKAGQCLNYDELVLYNPDGAFPKYIIVYQRDGENSIAKNMKSTIKTKTPQKK